MTRLPIATLAGSLGSRMKITLSYWRVSACSPAQPSCDHRSEFQYPTRPVADPQAGGLRSLGGTLARSVQHQLRRAALDEHLFRGRSAVSGRRQAALWVLARSPAGLCADRHCPGGDTRGAAAGVLPGNTADRTTLRPFLEHIERQYGKARRVWLMDRGVPSEEVLSDEEHHGELPAVLAGIRPFSILMTIH